jgi:hypothetical protein
VKQYAYALAVMLPEEADSIWGHCAGYPGSADKNAFRSYLLEHRKKPGLPFASYPEASVAKVRSSLALQERVIEFALDARDLEGPALETAFRQRFPEVV